ncbi:MAG: carbohydrate-binding protein [Ruminococcus sp.]|nr:carbohydrate-binding protein [Ruminococcus sp.]
MRFSVKRALAVLTAAFLVSANAAMLPAQRTAISASAAASIPAFPGAVGGGKYATGGRGGEVYHVTNLNDSGAGSFRDAVSKSNRIVVFDVSGTIELKSNVVCQSNVTIAGQTAPGGSGITLKNYKFGMGGDNIICRYISSRPGPYASTSSGNDAWGGAKGSNSIIDHCSMGWTTDEQWALYSNNEYYTVQYSVIGPADSWGGHSKGIHGFGIMMGKGFSTFDHNLIVHNVSRNFRGKVVGTSTADFTNNVIYNWAYQTAYGTIGHLNYVNNTLKMGNGTTGAKYYVSVDSSTSPQNFSIYMTGNRMLNKDSTVYDAVTANNWNGGVKVKDGLGITVDSVKSNTAFQTVVNGENVSTATTAESAAASYENVLNFAGNGISPTLRTAIDQQSAEECRTGTGYHSGTAAYDAATADEKTKIDNYKIQCGVNYVYPAAVLQKTITDTDNDGMPDEWEEVRGLNPNDASDANGDYCGQGYTNIEYYINDLTVDSFPAGVVTPSPQTGTLPTISAFEKIEAEQFDDQSGIRSEELASGGQNIGFIENGDYIMFKRVDFGTGACSFTANVSGNPAGMELYLDSLDTPVAVCAFDGTSGFTDYTEFSCNIGTITGTHDLYIRFTGGEGYLLNMDWFTFCADSLPINGRLIHDLQVFDTVNALDWKLLDNVQAGSPIFGDRAFAYTQLPAALLGAETILTACDSKNSTADLAAFTAAEDLDVYAAFDVRVDPLPAWISEWERTELTAASDNDVAFQFFKKSCEKGETVALGTNGQSAYCVNYAVFAIPAVNEPETLVGDVDSNGALEVLDLILYQKYLFGKAEFTAEQAIIADLNKDGVCNAFDLAHLKRLYLQT